MQQAVCVPKKQNRKKTHTNTHTKKSAPPKTHHEIHSGRDHLETARDETRPTRQPILARFRRSRVCGTRPRTALEINKNDECYDPGFVELGLVQPSKSTKTTNVTHSLTDTDRQTDGQTS